MTDAHVRLEKCIFRGYRLLQHTRRIFEKTGKTAVWCDAAGDDRKRIGDFACCLIFAESLNAG